ncbi:Uncharacterised protein [Bordetella pertussis]|nr:Uncharacterised protein [Bordetella pertussis]
MDPDSRAYGAARTGRLIEPDSTKPAGPPGGPRWRPGPWRQRQKKAFFSRLDADYRSSNRRCGSSSASFMATRPSTASRPSMMRWS